jgi:sortase A
MRRLAHILSIALITAGVVAFTDVGVTLVWQEPISAAYGSFKQHQAANELADLESRFPSTADKAAVQGVGDNARKAAALAKIFKGKISQGDAIGRVVIDRIGLNVVLIQGTDTASLQKGPGHYEYTPLPGQGETVGIAGHRTTYLAPFRHINDIQDGDEIRVEMPYGTFTYTVTHHKIVDPSDVQIVDPVGYEQLVLTACHPVYSAAERWAVFARLTGIDLET